MTLETSSAPVFHELRKGELLGGGGHIHMFEFTDVPFSAAAPW